jgi:solute carrier family 25 carnitine/acylcarnitine transporter 20/29
MKWFIDFMSGSISGACGILIGHPLDTIKCRMQINHSDYSNTLSASYRIIKEEKLWGLFKGCLSPTIFAIPINAMYKIN